MHVDNLNYRQAYKRGFPDLDLSDRVIDHVMNRMVARLKSFTYLRVLPVSRETNSSHGGLSEQWAVAHHSTPEMQAKNLASQASVQYADISDIVKMLNMQGGGSFMSIVNDAQALVDLSMEMQQEANECEHQPPREKCEFA